MINQKLFSLFFFSTSREDEHKLPRFCPQTHLVVLTQGKGRHFLQDPVVLLKAGKKPLKIILLFFFTELLYNKVHKS